MSTKFSQFASAAPGVPVTGVGLQSGANVQFPMVAQQIRVALTSSRLLHLFSAPVQIIPAPGAGLLVVVTNVVLNYTFVSSSYVTTGFDEGLYYAGDSRLLMANMDFTVGQSMLAAAYSPAVGGGASSGAVIPTGLPGWNYPGSGSIIGPAASPIGDAVQLAGRTADMTAGDGTATLTVLYTIVPV
jgi:hypothetical protein